MILAGVALTAASMVTSNIAQGQVDNARAEVLSTELQRQKGFDREVQDLNTQSQDRYVGFEAQQDQRADELANMFGSSVGDPNTASVMPPSSSNIVNRETDARKADAQAYVDQQSGALADMRSFGDLLGSTSLMQARDASKIGQLGGFKMGSQGVVPLELDHANKAGDGTKLFADLLRMGGTITTGVGINQPGSQGYYPGLNGPALDGSTNTWLV